MFPVSLALENTIFGGSLEW